MKYATLEKEVLAYLKRAEEGSFGETFERARLYEQDKEGFWRIFSGYQDELGTRDILMICQGNFIDVVMQAVQLSRFRG